MPQQRPSQWGVNWGSAQYETFYTSLMQTALLRKRGHQHPATPGVSPEMDTELSRLPNEPKARIDDECGADESTHESSTCIEEAMNNQLPWDDIIWEPPM